MKKLLLLILLGSCSSFTPITVPDRIKICESGLGVEKECAYLYKQKKKYVEKSMKKQWKVELSDDSKIVSILGYFWSLPKEDQEQVLKILKDGMEKKNG